MPRTSNLFITSPRAAAPPAVKTSCSGFNGQTPALTSGGQRELLGQEEMYQAPDHTPSSLVFLFSFSSSSYSFETSVSFIYGSDSTGFSCLFIPFLGVCPSGTLIRNEAKSYLEDQKKKTQRVKMCC